MRKKVIIIIVVIFILLGLVGFGVYKLVTSFKEDQAITAEKINEIEESYQEFNESIGKYAQQREVLYKALGETYLEDLAKNYGVWNEFIGNYEKIILDIEEKGKKLKEDCVVKFTDVATNNRCTTFKANYEAANNYYINDIKVYNKNAQNYNNWAENNNVEGRITEGKLVVYQDYIDFDEDGEFFGKDEVNE